MPMPILISTLVSTTRPNPKMNELSNIDIRTARKRKADERREAVTTMYSNLRHLHPSASENAIFQAVAYTFGLTIPGVRSICIKAGVTQPVIQQKTDK